MRRAAPFLWYAFIFATSCTFVHRDTLVAAMPAPAREGFDALWSHAWWVFVKGWHMAEFGALYLLFRRSGRDEGWALFLVSLAATLDEFHRRSCPAAAEPCPTF